MELTLSQGGSVYSMSPLVTLVNPSGTTPFTFTTGDFLSTISSPQSTHIHQPYSKNHTSLDYQKWLITMSDRAWRQSRDLTSTSGARELYPVDALVPSTNPNEYFKLPSQTKVFQITIPESSFGAGAGLVTVGVLKFATHIMFS